MYQNNRKACLEVYLSIYGEKQFLLIIVPFYWFDQKHFINFCLLLLVWWKNVVWPNSNFPKDLPLFKHGKKNKLSAYITARFWDSQFLD